jgi:hypothetical protein
MIRDGWQESAQLAIAGYITAVTGEELNAKLQKHLQEIEKGDTQIGLKRRAAAQT